MIRARVRFLNDLTGTISSLEFPPNFMDLSVFTLKIRMRLEVKAALQWKNSRDLSPMNTQKTINEIVNQIKNQVQLMNASKPQEFIWEINLK